MRFAGSGEDAVPQRSDLNEKNAYLFFGGGGTFKGIRRGPPVASPSGPAAANPARDSTAARPPENTWVRIVNRNSNLGIAVREGKKSPEADVLQWTAGGLESHWRLVAADGFWTIENQNSRLVMGVAGGSRRPGASIHQEVKSADSRSQQWTVEPAGDRFWKIVNRNSGHALAIAGARKARGNVACQSPVGRNPEQQWEFVPAER